jgi:hypothetical protein
MVVTNRFNSIWEENMLTKETQDKMYVTFEASQKIVIGLTFTANKDVCIISMNCNKTVALTSI